MKHNLWMIIGNGLPLLLIFFAPALGLDSGTSLFIFMIAMFACHLFMPMHGYSHGSGQQQNSISSKTGNHEHP